MGGPDWLLVLGTGTAGRQQGADIGDELGLDEQVLEGRVSGIGSLRRESYNRALLRAAARLYVAEALRHGTTVLVDALPDCATVSATAAAAK